MATKVLRPTKERSCWGPRSRSKPLSIGAGQSMRGHGFHEMAANERAMIYEQRRELQAAVAARMG